MCFPAGFGQSKRLKVNLAGNTHYWHSNEAYSRKPTVKDSFKKHYVVTMLPEDDLINKLKR